MQKELKQSEIIEKKVAWKSPVISRIDIKRTMNGSPGINDLSTGSKAT